MNTSEPRNGVMFLSAAFTDPNTGGNLLSVEGGGAHPSSVSDSNGNMYSPAKSDDPEWDWKFLAPRCSEGQNIVTVTSPHPGVTKLRIREWASLTLPDVCLELEKVVEALTP